jgi:hypothetical protein
MFNCLAHITIETDTQVLNLRSLVEFESEQTWRNLTNTATLQLPRKIYFADGVEDIVKRGSAITISVGYGTPTEERLVERFKGYVAYVSNEIPVKVQCEDEMFLHKKQTVKPKEWVSTTLKDVLNYCGITNYTALGEYNLGAFKITTKETTVAKVMDKLRKDFGIYCFYRKGKLHCGNPYSSAKGKPVTFAIGYNIEKSDLEYRRKDEVLLKVTAISNKKDGKKIKVSVGDEEGEHRTLNFYNLEKADLEKQATQLLDSLKCDGFKGHITTWGEPVVNEGDLIELVNPEYPEQDGIYWCDKVAPTAGGGGIRQKIYLGAKA